MPIRKRLAVSEPRTVNHDAAIREAFRAGVAILKREIDDGFTEKEDDLRSAYARIAFLEEALRHDGILQLVKQEAVR